MVQKVLRGRGSLARISTLMEKLGMQRPLLICGDTLYEAFKAQTGLDPVRFHGYHPNPDYADCAAGADMYREQGCDGIISLGGGSAIDTAKAVKAMLTAEDADRALKGQVDASVKLPHIAIPGTAGSGAEATYNAVVYVNNQKCTLANPALLPEGAVLDGALLDSLPEYHRKSCAMDALCQGIESFWSKDATGDSKVNAYLAILGVLDNIRGYLAGDPHAADQMLEASYRSGCAIRVSRTTAAHAMSYQITKKLGLAHGHACMLTLPVLWDHMVDNEDVLATLMELSSAMRLGSEHMGSRLLRGMMIDLGLEYTQMPEEETLDALADSVNIERLSNHPEALTRDQLRRIYRQAFTPVTGMQRQVCVDLWAYYGK